MSVPSRFSQFHVAPLSIQILKRNMVIIKLNILYYLYLPRKLRCKIAGSSNIILHLENVYIRLYVSVGEDHVFSFTLLLGKIQLSLKQFK